MRIALAATRHINRNVSYNLSQMERFMREAAAKSADFVCFGEAFLQGFDCLDWNYAADRNMAITTQDEPFMCICRLSQEIGIDILFGFIEREDETLYSSAALVADGALFQLYRRISRGWKEYWHTDEHYREGDSVSVFEYRGQRFAIALCGDLWDMPERFALGEDILLWPVHISYAKADWEGGEGAAYAAQARLACKKTLLVNNLADGDAYGGAFCFEDGRIAAALPMDEEGLLVVEV